MKIFLKKTLAVFILLVVAAFIIWLLKCAVFALPHYLKQVIKMYLEVLLGIICVGAILVLTVWSVTWALEILFPPKKNRNIFDRFAGNIKTLSDS